MNLVSGECVKLHNGPAQFVLTLSWQGNSEISRVKLLYMHAVSSKDYWITFNHSWT